MGHGDDDNDDDDNDDDDDESSLHHLRFTCALLAPPYVRLARPLLQQTPALQITSGGAAHLIRPKQLGPCLTLTHTTGFLFRLRIMQTQQDNSAKMCVESGVWGGPTIGTPFT